MSKELNSNKLNGKDLINAGIFSAIYVVIIMLVACTVGMIPIGFILLTLLVPLLEGIPMMLYFSKIKKVGMIMILQVVIGLAMIITGMGYDLLIWGIVTGIIAEIIMKVTKYKKGIACVLLWILSLIRPRAPSKKSISGLVLYCRKCHFSITICFSYYRRPICLMENNRLLRSK